MMKKITTFLFFLFIGQLTFSQLIINAGSDTTMCTMDSQPAPFYIGGNPTVSGGEAPYTFTWEANYELIIGNDTYTLTGSDFLSDTTIANPQIIATRDEVIPFILTVTDNDGITEKDTVIVRFSFFYQHLIEYSHHMMFEDSIKFVSLPNIEAALQPATYLWRPNLGLSDSTSFSDFWVKPEVSTSYYLTVTDAAGCKKAGGPMFHVYIGYMGLADINNYDDISIYPNPATNKILIGSSQDFSSVLITDQLGKIVKQFSDINGDFDVSDLPTGYYTISMKSENKLVNKNILISK